MNGWASGRHVALSQNRAKDLLTESAPGEDNFVNHLSRAKHLEGAEDCANLAGSCSESYVPSFILTIDPRCRISPGPSFCLAFPLRTAFHGLVSEIHTIWSHKSYMPKSLYLQFHTAPLDSTLGEIWHT